MAKHTMRLSDQPFTRVRMGVKKIEFRLNDAKRQKIQVGDRVVFIHLEDESQTIETCVTKRIEAKCFSVLFDDIDPLDIGYTEEDRPMLKESMRAYYTAEDEEKHGVVALYVQAFPKEV